MIKPDWNVFKAKFSDNPQFHFEWFCYLLFCREFKQPYGVFRYKNQSGIETDPIESDGINVGFQSKFYDTSLSSNKSELISTLVKSKRDYPSLEKLFLYTNQEWTQTFHNKKAEKTAAQVDIEEKAEELEIEIVWRTTSYFESPFVTHNCSDLSKYFFLNGDSILDLIEKQQSHTHSILKNIKATMLFNGQEISINRDNIQTTLQDESVAVSIICGQGGVGKTVEIKRLIQEKQSSFALFAFKATEFELRELDDLFAGKSVSDFLSFFGDVKNKALVIDSAEKLMDLDNQEPFKEFVDLAVQSKWRIIFTTRDYYFDDLNHLCLDVLQVVPQKLYISELTNDELESLAHEYKFQLPDDSRLKELLKLPIYLNAFLKFYGSRTEVSLSFSEFKDYLWNKIIKNNDVRREKVFSDLAMRRANEGKFYIPLSGSEIEVANTLLKDEVLGIEGSSFFISHDIYEEWALEKIIDMAFKNRQSVGDFFKCLGLALSIRRSFRLWLSEKLRLDSADTKFFIDQALEEESISSVWKDELIAAILLSDYSYSFFENFKRELLSRDLDLLQRVSFILRIACKQLDNSILKLLGLKQSGTFYFTKPKGKGWEAFIGFLYAQKEQIGFENLRIFVPALYEWNSSVKNGETTQKASLLCLEYYEQSEPMYSYSRDGKLIDSVLKTIAYGALEIKSELSTFIDKACKAKQTKRTRYYDNFAKLLLKESDGIYVAKALPSKVLEMASTYWLKEYTPDNQYRSYKEKEQIFGVADEFDFNYNPESAYQTPIFSLLSFDLKTTVDFVLKFIDKVTDNLITYYSDSDFPTAKLTIDDTTSEIVLDQYLWGAYRGNDGAPNLVKSILMALEKFFLERAKDTEAKYLELWLKYLLKHTKSSAICGVVASIVLANRDKLFNVAMILFEVKEFIQFDITRTVFDSQHKRQLEMLGSMFGGFQHNKAHQDERIKSCDVPHRRESLESLILYYQLFGLKGEVEELEVQHRQNKIWALLDKYYQEIEVSKGAEDLKLWRMSLARMDRRKMNITTEDMGDKIALNFNPELTPDLKEMSDNNQLKQEQDFKYSPLLVWSRSKLNQNEDYKKYQQYESSPVKAMEDLNELVSVLTDMDNRPSDSFIQFNRSTHIYASAALLKYHYEDLSKEQQSLCISIVGEEYEKLFNENYRYQISDGLDACFTVIPEMFSRFPEYRAALKLILVAGLIRTDSIDIHGSQRFSAYAIAAIVKLWSEFEQEVRSIYLGFLLLNPLYSNLIEKIRQESFEKKQFEVSFDGLWKRLLEENESIISAIDENGIGEAFNIDYEQLDMYSKSVAIFILPNKTLGWSKEAFMKLLDVSAHSLLTDEEDRSNNFQSAKEFFKKSTYYILSSRVEEISELLTPYITHFSSSEGTADLLEEFVLAQDSIAAYEQFWEVWELFKPKVLELAQKGYLGYRSEKVIKAYLCALPWWKPEAKSWHTFKAKDSRFFAEMSNKLSQSPTTFYSIAKLLNDIGSEYLPNGVYWLAQIIDNNKSLLTTDLDDDTIYYVNKYMRRYLYRERANVRRTPELMAKTLTVLNFLIEKGEVSGYLMRENVV
ncbi:AVAST type 4 anti-phage nuclease Avs4 [Pseudoalteromonas tetraodonis]|uniref:AVAST type 4 anti-phage nuclease Avs4 n=1 Tax=Pseudoalteromonas tetraodonis TaxID=43659 RepID=UPI0008497339|nr:AVAST type 4 anti-phage nuclease Avs4 [Pseudoalteromonas tetraodonis]ODS15317.1 hypothetical protein BCD66_05825 [Pseudoalteromonas tetraodonis]